MRDRSHHRPRKKKKQTAAPELTPNQEKQIIDAVEEAVSTENNQLLIVTHSVPRPGKPADTPHSYRHGNVITQYLPRRRPRE